MATKKTETRVTVPSNESPESQNLLTPKPTEEDKRVAQNKSPIFMNVCEAQTKFLRLDEKKCSKYKFEYGNTAFGNGSIDLKRKKPSKKPNASKYKKILSWQELNNLRVDQKWDTIRHPYVLHFINQKLLDCAGFYTAHIIVATLLFILLACHIIFPYKIIGVPILILTAVTAFVLGVKCAAKGQHLHVSHWFRLGATFNFLTYAATAAYIITPWLATFDDNNPKLKKLVIWFLPIFAIISTWLNLLYALRKSPFGIYVLMLTRILRSFAHIAVIWIPTLITFSFVFLLVMRGSGVKPWPPLSSNSTDFHNATFELLQAIAKTSTMMLGEVDANDILETQKWIPSILVLVFEVITIILLMNLMVSLAVGDVNDLKKEAEDTILKIKLNYVIEALQLREGFSKVFHFESKEAKNGLVINDNGEYVFREVVFGKIDSKDPNSKDPNSKDPNSKQPNSEENKPAEPVSKDSNSKDPNSKKTKSEEPNPEEPKPAELNSKQPNSEEPNSEETTKSAELNSAEPDPKDPTSKKTKIDGTSFEKMPEEVKDNWWLIYSKWLIGLDMAAYLKNAPPALQQA